MTKTITRITTSIVALALFSGIATQGMSAYADSPAPAANPISTLAGGLNPMNWKMPEFKMPSFKSLLPGQEEKTRIVNKKDGLVSEVTQTASKSWQKTKDVFNPKRLIPTNMFAGNNATQSGASGENPGFFSSLLNGPQKQAAPPAKEEQVATVSDFLGQPKMTR